MQCFWNVLSDTELRVAYECVAEIFLNGGKKTFGIWLLCILPINFATSILKIESTLRKFGCWNKGFSLVFSQKLLVIVLTRRF